MVAALLIVAPRFALSQESTAPASKLALRGYCPVTLVDTSKWVSGDPQFQLLFDGQLYRFASAEQKQLFLASPAKYAPALGGDCAVCFARSNKRVPGDLNFGVQHKGRFYFFAEQKQKDVFFANPDAFENVDLALNGNCAVSKVANRRDVPGSADFTVVHKGIRFQFVSAEHKAAFEAEPGKYEDAGKPLLALNGHCVVCLRDGNEWVKGTEEFATVHDGREYRFPGAPQRDAFLAAPNNYVPVLGGDCVVCLAKKGERVAGSIFHATYFRDRLYLFPSLEIKQQFKAAPESYANVDVALNGNCAVCWVKGGKQVAGSTEFQYVYQGLRYFFPSATELNEFKSSPATYVRALGESGARTDPNVAPQNPADEPNAKAGTVVDNSEVDKSDAGKLVSLKGVSGCAGCDHGVAPLKSPDELGLAVVAGDGSIYVVEEAHKLYKSIYDARFDEIKLAVSGTIIQRKGKFVWIDPRAVKALQ